jgi:hypothetical protein
MFRLSLSLLSLLLISVTGAVDIESALGRLQLQRALQIDASLLDDLVFNFAGQTFSAAVAAEKCPDPWNGVLQCIIKDCPEVMTACPDLTEGIPAEYVGSACKFFYVLRLVNLILLVLR